MVSSDTTAAITHTSEDGFVEKGRWRCRLRISRNAVIVERVIRFEGSSLGLSLFHPWRWPSSRSVGTGCHDHE
jgi:hypothetical protein